MKKKSLLMLIVILIVCTGCSSQSTTTSNEISELQTAIDNLQQQVLDQSIKIGALEYKLSNIAYLDPSTKGYSKSGDFLVLISEVEEYLDGLKVYLEIGNPNYATYSEITIKTKYGTKFDLTNTTYTYTEWEESLKEMETKLSTELDIGNWNKVEIILPSISPKDFSHFEVEIITDSISLIRK